MELKSPLDVQVEVTSSCNYRCGYCYNPFEHSSYFMSKEQVSRVVEELVLNDVFSVIFTGGEPFMNREVLMKGLKLAKGKGMKTYVNSNLSLPIDNSELEILRGVNNLLFSIPSSDKQEYEKITRGGGWEKFIDNLGKLSLEGITLTGNQVITPFNKGDIYETALFLKSKFDIMNYSATPVNPSGGGRQQYSLERDDYTSVARDLIKVNRDLGMHVEMLTCLPPCLFPEDIIKSSLEIKSCSAGKSSAAIGVKGDVRKCVELEKGYGNIFETPFNKIWRVISLEPISPIESCNGCVISGGCEIGCEARSIQNGGMDPLGGKPMKVNHPKKLIPLEESREYKVKDFLSREEKDGKYIITDGGTFFLEGNREFVMFLANLKKNSFNIRDINNRFGIKGVGLVKYLNEKGLLI